MTSIVGFTAWRRSSPETLTAARAAQGRVVRRFDRLTTRTLSVGVTTLDLWGAGAMETRWHEAPDGSTLVLIGTPMANVSWSDLPRAFMEGNAAASEELPWEGRVLLLRVSADGERWTLWNDWLGSIPVFHAASRHELVASTLEPAVVAAMGFTPNDINVAALLSILINGHLLSDWTFYRGMRTVRPDSVSTWDEEYRSRRVGTVVPTADRWETSWSELVEEKHALATQAVTDALRTSPSWMLPLSGGLDSRLIACVAASNGHDVTACAWGPSNTVDVVCSRAVARKLDIPWSRVDLGTGYLKAYTRPWAEWFGSTLHFHGMYQMAFYDAVAGDGSRPVMSGFLNDVLSGGSGRQVDATRGQLYNEWYGHWTIEELRRILRVPIDDALAELSAEIDAQFHAPGGAMFQRDVALEVWNRCPLFVSFQLTLADYWRGAAAPYVNRAHARFCFSLPLAALEHKSLLRDVIRRFYPAVAAIAGTYGEDPLLRTGSYLLKRRLAARLPRSMRRGPLKVFGAVDPRMDCDALRTAGREGLWPIPETERALAEWLDVGALGAWYDRAVSDARDYRALRRLQSVQTLAYCLIES